MLGFQRCWSFQVWPTTLVHHHNNSLVRHLPISLWHTPVVCLFVHSSITRWIFFCFSTSILIRALIFATGDASPSFRFLFVSESHCCMKLACLGYVSTHLLICTPVHSTLHLMLFNLFRYPIAFGTCSSLEHNTHLSELHTVPFLHFCSGIHQFGTCSAAALLAHHQRMQWVHPRCCGAGIRMPITTNNFPALAC